MKHHLRSDKTCLNCGAEVTDRFCSHCGQENVEPKETFGSLVHHFVGDITHYDSKFFITLKDLLFKPGYLTNEYIAGRRNRYLNPIRTYVFISILFFVALFFKKNDEPLTGNEAYDSHYINIARQHIADSLKNSVSTVTGQPVKEDSLRVKVIKNIASSLDTLAIKDTSESISFQVGNKGVRFELQEDKYSTIEEYDSVQNTLPPDKRDKGFLRWVIRTNVHLKSRYGSRSDVVLNENFEHNIPKIMFVLLPLFAWFIYLFHNRKKYYYAQHAIFSVHFHSFMFVLLLLITIIGWVLPGINALFILLPSLLILFVYLALALKTTYHQSFLMASLKTLTIGLLYIISLVICIIGLAFINFFTA